MRWIERRDDEAGTAAVFFAVLITLFLTLVSLVVDVGRVFDEHGQLSAGADAAALAVAAECARVPDDCGLTWPSLVHEYVSGNARDGRSEVESVAFSGGADRGTVTVHTRSLAPGGGDLPLSRPRDGSETAIVRATATASWAPVRGATTLPMAVSICNLRDALVAQGGYHLGPAPASDLGTVIPALDLDPGDEDDGDGVEPAPPPGCSVGGAASPAGFTDLRDGTDCEVTTSWDTGRWLASRNGAERVDGCLSVATVGTVVAVPIFDAACAPRLARCPGDTGSSFGVRLVGYGALLVTGWRLPGSASPVAPTCPETQPPPARCISGFFTRLVLAGVPIDMSTSGPTPLGVSSVQLTPSDP